jgi:hypothetical protein
MKHPTQLTRARRGVTAMLAMMYLVLFATLALGFYSSTNTAVQVASNDQRIARALLAAESGMEFMSYQLSIVDVPPEATESELWPNLIACLRRQLDGTPNIASKSIYTDNETIRVPATPEEFIKLDEDGGEFQATITNRGHKILVSVRGRYGETVALGRGVQMEFGLAEKAHRIFDYGIATKGSVATSGQARITGAVDPAQGSILATSMTNPTPVDIQGPLVSGDISVVNPGANVAFGRGASIGGTNDPTAIVAEHIHKGVKEPEFPTINTDVFKSYVTNPATGLPRYYTGGAVLENVVIRANTNPTFAGGVTIRGVVYVETPNVVTFRGNSTIQGLLVGPSAPTGNVATNAFNFAGNVQVQGVETLPETFGGLKKMTGSFLLAPGFAASFTGNFGRVDGSMVADKFTFSGSATGVIRGTVINMKDNVMTVGGSSEVIIAGNGTANFPAGLTFSKKYESLPDTYEELR